MASFWSIAPEVAAATTTANKVHFQLNELTNITDSVPSDIRNLEYEVRELCRILGELGSVLRDREHQDELFMNLGSIIESCSGELLNLEMLVHNYWIKKGDGKLLQRLKGLRWALQEKQVAALRAQLEVQRTALDAILQLSAGTQRGSAKDSSGQLKEAVRELLIQQNGGSVAATYSPAYTLLGYVSDSSTIFPQSSKDDNIAINPSGKVSSGGRVAKAGNLSL